MASPQIENGFTRIANEILENIAKVNLNGTQFRLVLTILRYTYGYDRKEHEFALSYLAKAINASRSQVDRELKALVERQIIVTTGYGYKGAKKLSFNKNYEEWQESTTAKRQFAIVEQKKQKPKKQVEKKQKSKEYTKDNSYYKMALYFFNKVSLVAKEAGVEHLVAKANMQKWADEFRKMIEIDKVDKRLAKDVMDWVTQDSFWKTNVLSAKKLREKFGELAIKMKSQSSKQPISKPGKKDIRDKEIEFQRWIANGGEPSEFDWGC